MTYDSTNFRLYRNGVLDTTSGAINPTTASGGTLYVAFNLGGNPWSGTAIDDLRIYNRALSTAEVKQLYQLGR